jgi:hypothetical protein
MSDLNPKINAIDRLMVRAHRKQISLCRECHMNKHHNAKPENKILDSIIGGEPYDTKASRTVRERGLSLVTGGGL